MGYLCGLSLFLSCFIGNSVAIDAKYLIMFPDIEGQPQRWMTSQEIENITRTRHAFIDITKKEYRSIQTPFPTKPLPTLTAEWVQDLPKKIISFGADLETSYLPFWQKLTEFRSRFWNTKDGVDAGIYIVQEIEKLVAKYPSSADLIEVEVFEHNFGSTTKYTQPSIIVRWAGQGILEDRVILGSHYDTVPANDGKPRPGADDDGSGTAVLFGLLKFFLESSFTPHRPVEFHFYAAEEIGLKGSRDISTHYRKANVPVYGYHNHDMLSWTDDKEDRLWILLGRTINAELGDFTVALGKIWNKLGDLITPTAIANRQSSGSDHASWNQSGYRTSNRFETDGLDNPHYHKHTDAMDTVNLTHINQNTLFSALWATTMACSEDFPIKDCLSF